MAYDFNSDLVGSQVVWVMGLWLNANARLEWPGGLWRYPLNEARGRRGGLWWFIMVSQCTQHPLSGFPWWRDHRQSAPEMQSVGHTCGQSVATYLWATYSQVGLNIGHCGQADICGIAVGCDHIFRICWSIFGSNLLMSTISLLSWRALH